MRINRPTIKKIKPKTNGVIIPKLRKISNNPAKDKINNMPAIK